MKADLTGKKFGKLTAVKIVGKDKQRNNLWNCKCDCGNEIVVRSCELKRGHCKSCGCFQKEQSSKFNKTHGESKSKLYNVWIDMKARCKAKTHHAYKWYGEKGVSVCKEWDNDYLAFKKWSIDNGYKDGLTIDRIDSNGNYCPENCRWATRKQQSNNISSCVYFDFMGERLNITQFCEKYNVSHSHFYSKARKNICLDNLMRCILTSKSRITNEEWARLCEGYEQITGEVYQI